MGSALSVKIIPAHDDRILKTIQLSQIDDVDISRLYDHFQRILKKQKNVYNTKSDRIHIDSFFNEIDESRSRYGMCLFELLDIYTPSRRTEPIDTTLNTILEEKDVSLNFGEFVQSIVTICLLEKDDILRYCFYIFDCNKNGFIDNDELDTMLDLLHNVHENSNSNSLDENKMKGDLKLSRRKIEEEIDRMAIAGELEFMEMKRFLDKYPRLFYPAFRIQNKLMFTYFGFRWWEIKKQKLQVLKAKQARKDDIVLQTNILVERIRQRRIRQEMGVLPYYLFPWKRKNLHDKFPKRMMKIEELDIPNQQELNVLRTKMKEAERITINIPDTQEWKGYIESKKKEKSDLKGIDVKPRHTFAERQLRTERRRKLFL